MDTLETPEILYHYTDAKGLLGILDTNEIWATSYRIMNDAREFEYGFDLISEAYPQRGNRHDRFGELPFEDSTYAEAVKKNKWVYESDCIFVASFSAEHDLLSQWRGYAGLHSGYSIGIRSDSLKKSNFAEAILMRCSYEKSQQLEMIKSIIDNYLPRMRAEEDIIRMMDHASMAAHEVACQSIQFKHKSFGEEREWRLVVGPIDPVYEKICHRAGEMMIIPYVKIYYPKGVQIEHIVVGPGPHQERNAGSLRQMLLVKGKNAVRVDNSIIPFRPW
jgi:hypothetical protein